MYAVAVKYSTSLGYYLTVSVPWLALGFKVQPVELCSPGSVRMLEEAVPSTPHSSLALLPAPTRA